MEVENRTILAGEPIARGRTAEVYAWRDDHILKLFYAWCPATWIQREVQTGRVIASLALPTPKCLDTVIIDGRQGIIYERVHGYSMLRELSTAPWHLPRLARQFAELHTAIHVQSGAGLSSLRAYLYTTIDQVDLLTAAMKSTVLQALDRLPDGAALCHFDFHPGQVMRTPDGLVVLDWMTALQGHPLADVARTAIILAVGEPPHAGWCARSVTKAGKGIFSRQYLQHYLALNPSVNRADIDAWTLPIAAARLHENIPGEQPALLSFLANHSRADH